MSDEAMSSATPVADHPGSSMSAGALLRQAREASGLHVAALAVAMKVPVKKLEALEADRWDLLTDAVFVRGLAASVCRALKVDPTDILSKLPQSVTPRLGTQAREINTTFQASRQSPVASATAYISKPAVLVVFGLLLAALVILFFPNTHSSTTVATPTAEPLPPIAQGSTVFASEPVAQSSEPVVPAVTTAPLAAPAVSAPALALQVASAPAAMASAVASVAAKVASVPAAIAALRPASVPVAGVSSPKTAGSAPATIAVLGNGSIAVKARAKSWVEVVDAHKVVLIRRSLAAGENVEVSGALPLAVVIGAVDAVSVEVRGKPFGLEPIAISNVARFEVK